MLACYAPVAYYRTMSRPSPGPEFVPFDYQDMLDLDPEATVGQATFALYGQVDKLFFHPLDEEPPPESVLVHARDWPLAYSDLPVEGTEEPIVFRRRANLIDQSPESLGFKSLGLLSDRIVNENGVAVDSWPAGAEASRAVGSVGIVEFLAARYPSLEGEISVVHALVRPIRPIVPEQRQAARLQFGIVSLDEQTLLEEVAEDPEHIGQVFLEACKGIMQTVRDIQQQSQPA